MNVKNVEKENGAAKVTIEIARDEFQTALDKAYAKIRKDIMIPGFRKGKAPRKFVERMYGSQVFYEDAVNEIFPEIYEAAIVKQELKAVGQPSVTDMQTPEDGSVVLTVSTELYPEVTLGQYYRIKGKDGVYYGGPMYYIERGMGKKWKPLAIFFAVTIILGGLGTAAFAQPYTMSTALERTFHIPAWVVTVAAAAICGIVLIGGVKGIGKFCEKITPAMCLIYVVGALGVIIVNIRFVPQAFAAIFKYAFAPMPAIGGLAGSTLALALRQGAARGTFSNEAGCGSSPITHATAITDHPFKEGMYGSFEVFVDTIIVCTMTSLAIMCSGSDIWASGVKAEALTMSAFDTTYGTTIGNLLVTIPLALFAFSTMVGWEINYESAFFYIFPKMETSKIFKVLIRVLWLVPGFIALGNTDLVWTVVDIASGLWCVPNAIALIALSGVFMKIYHDYNDKYILKTRPISEPLPYIGKD